MPPTAGKTGVYYSNYTAYDTPFGSENIEGYYYFCNTSNCNSGSIPGDVPPLSNAVPPGQKSGQDSVVALTATKVVGVVGPILLALTLVF